ncbi:hypothetical protein M0802_000671 [Mischocyttarus mexicanus]|nr:hypothetical protein M0802_000671 [Mischocyttarus mexicanus]
MPLKCYVKIQKLCWSLRKFGSEENFSLKFENFLIVKTGSMWLSKEVKENHDEGQVVLTFIETGGSEKATLKRQPTSCMHPKGHE